MMQDLLSNDLFSRVFLGWTLLDWGRLIGLGLLIGLALRLVRFGAVRYFGRIAKRTAVTIDDAVVEFIRGTRLFFLIIVGFYLAGVWLGLEGMATIWLKRITVLALLIQFGLWGSDLIRWWLHEFAEARAEGDPARLTAMRAFALVGRIVLWCILLLLGLENFGVDITALATGLGIGGIAIALAVQNVLKDLLAYVSILVDRPFVVGDFLVVGDFMGSVETIGVKSSRLKSISGEQLVFGNTDLLSSRIRNYKRMEERRALFTVGVEYGTPSEVLERIPTILRESVESLKDVRFDRAHLKTFADSAIAFEVVYYLLIPDYNFFMDRQQAINLEIYRRFTAEDIAFAFPTQTLHVASVPPVLPEEAQTDS